MFEALDTAPPDPILGLSEAFRSNPNPHKINLSVGVYQTEEGRTPILECVKEAERRLVSDEPSKNYLGIDGLPEYGHHVRELMFGADHEILASKRAVTLQTPGGTGALRVAADFLKRKLPSAKVWFSKPTWANHPSVFAAAGVSVEQYAYIDAAGTGLDRPALLDALRKIPNGDVVCLHACCHNPTGIDPTPEMWQEIATIIRERKLLPLVDFAYQGFGDGLLEDAQGLRALCHPGCEMLVCSSFSKNFGLYAERVGALTIVAGNEEVGKAALSHAKVCVRVNFSNPPKHGGAIVATILGDAGLRQMWEQELAAMRDRIHQMRSLFVATMKQKAPQKDFSFLAQQRGMFSFSGLTPLQVDELRNRFAIYVVSAGGRINVAGMTTSNMDRLCAAIAAVL